MTVFCVAVVLLRRPTHVRGLLARHCGRLCVLRAFLTGHFFSDVMVGSAIGILATRETLIYLFQHITPSWF